MPDIPSQHYTLAFANYVFEHVAELNAAAKELHRVLEPSGYLILSLPNPSAPKFFISKHTPLWFHQLIKGKGEGAHKEAFETHYAYKNIKEITNLFSNNDFTLVETQYYPFTYGYLHKFPFIGLISKAYDAIVKKLNFKFLQGNMCVIFQKNNNQ